MALVMSAGPQIVTATFLATSHHPRRNSLAFLAAVGAATTIGVTIFFLFGSSLGGEKDEGKTWVDWLIVALLVGLVIRVYVKRNETNPPKWMGRLGQVDAGFAAKIRVLALFRDADGRDQHGHRRCVRRTPRRVRGGTAWASSSLPS